MKKVLVWTLAIILVLGSIGLFAYPFVSNYLMSIRNESAVVQYLNTTRKYPDELYDKIRKESIKYNKSLLNNVVTNDQFKEKYHKEELKELMSIDDSNIMCILDIPKLDLNIPVYYGTEEEILSKGIGLMENTSLPVGGKGTHSVLTGHTGYGGLRLFTDLEAMKKGDVFYVLSLGKTLTYQVDDIQVVLPEETENVRLYSGKDYVTLVTCTPYGINSHRLLVRGTRISEKTVTPEKLIEQSESKWEKEYSKAIITGVCVMVSIILAFVVIRVIIFVWKRKRKKDEENNC